MRNNRGSVTVLILIVIILTVIIWLVAPKLINAKRSVENSAATHAENTMIATTIRSSARVKPRLFFFKFLSSL